MLPVPTWDPSVAQDSPWGSDSALSVRQLRLDQTKQTNRAAQGLLFLELSVTGISCSFVCVLGLTPRGLDVPGGRPGVPVPLSKPHPSGLLSFLGLTVLVILLSQEVQ